MNSCPECQSERVDESNFCARCGYRFASGIPNIPSAEGPKKGGTKAGVYIGGATILLILFLFFGNFRFVSGAPSGIVKRQYFGFDEPFASVADCTSTAWIIATAQHGPLCSDLQAAGILESDQARESRVRREVESEMRELQGEIEREQQRMMRSLGY